ncbi:hypothetical protein [Roseateles sp. LYH14W]|uniref:DUF4124 domain-containing protein n=1 Tax=Pelomonas parva TaxID=3299032 RepID=A0ABW7FA05_9BURK
MSLRAVVIAAACLGALILAWQKREPLQAWARSAQTAAAPAAAPLRKCVNGQQVTYTNAPCPPGHKEQAVTAAPVNVLPATPVRKPVEASSAPLLHQALDVKQEPTLKDKMMERAIDGVR